QSLPSNVVTVTVYNISNIDFTYSNNLCSGSTIQFNTNAIGSSYTWNFGDGNTSSLQNPSHIFSAFGCGLQNYTVTLTVFDQNGCSSSKSYVIGIKKQPDVNFEDLNVFNPYSNCGNASISNPNFTITVYNSSTSTACISSYNVDWGDSSPIEENITFPLNHTYNSLGLFYFKIYAIGNNGCVTVKTYAVKNESNPSGGISSPGSTQNLCAPTANILFQISNWALNSPTTTYTIDYGDNTPIVTLVQAEMVLTSYYNSTNPTESSNYPIPHSYSSSSCPNNSISATLTVTNSCGSTTGTVSPISILKKPNANFSNPEKACVNSTVIFTNLSDSGNGLNCSTNTIYLWNFGDGTPIINTGQLSSPQNITHAYSSPGVYTITLTAIGYCSGSNPSIFTNEICIEPQIIPQFSLSNTSICSSTIVNASNTTNLNNVCSALTYSWDVTYLNGYCGSSPAVWNYVNNTSSSSENPSFNFITPGTYSIKVTVTGSTCGIVSSAVQTVIVKQPPTVSINTISDYCGTATISPVAVVNSCAPATSNLTYLWDFTGATTIPSGAINAINPMGVVYTIPGTYTMTLTVSNECGSTTTSKTFKVKPLPTAVVSSDITVCQNATAPTITFTATSNTAIAPNTTTPPYIFTYNINGGSNLTVTSSATSATATVSVPTGTPGTYIYNLVSVQYGSAPSCSQNMTGNATVVVNPLGQVNQPSNQIVCHNANTTTINFTTTNTGGTTTYTWTNNNTAIGLAAASVGNVTGIPSFVATNDTSAPITA
ncbi:MAG: PKD domain-containing protein, partial [Dolichospermum sp.]